MTVARVLAIVAMTGTISLGAGCAGHAEGAARAAAVDFSEAVSSHDGTRACALLGLATRTELEKSSGKGCAAAILEEDLPRAGKLERLASYGTMAQARFSGDVVFVTEFRSGWRVMAAGCTPVPGHPYDCQLKGG